jgi:hypothetical protein
MRCLLTGNSSSQVTELLNGNGTEAALNEPLSAIKAHSLGVDLQGVMETALLAQTTSPQDGFILVAKLNQTTLADVIDLGALTEEPPYKGHAVYSEPSSDLNVTMLPTGILVVGQAGSVAALIDVHEGDATSAETGAAVGPYLVDLASASPVTFVYGLPAMYESVDAGLTLTGSQAISGRLDLAGGTFSGGASFYTADAQAFADSYNTSAADYNKPVTAFPAEAGKVERLDVSIPSSAIHKSAEEIIASRHELKRLFHIMEAKDNTDGIASFTDKPWVNFTVLGDPPYPPSVFINYEIRPDQVQPLTDYLVAAERLPDGFVMKPLAIIESDPAPAYYLVLNYYTMTGLAVGVRYEWSIFVEDPENGKPRFLVIDALAEGITMDPVQGLNTVGDPVSHTHDTENDQLVSIAQKHDGSGGQEHYFTAIIDWPPAGTPVVSSSTREFVTANDFIYWGGGICDHGKYNGSVHNRSLTVISPNNFQITDDTPWFDYVHATPRSVYVYQNTLDIVLSPWWNLQAGNLDMTQEWFEHLEGLFVSSYTFLKAIDINNAFMAQGEVLIPSEAANSTPAAYFNYLIPPGSVAAFESALGLPEGYSLEPTQILEGDPGEAHYLTLKVFAVDDAVEGTRAEWSVYVDDGNGREHFMVIDLMTQDAALDPMSLLHLPNVVEHDLVGNTLSTTLASSAISFSATLDVTDGVEVLQTLDWVEAFDYVCYLNGICDKNYFGEGTLETPLLSVDPALAGTTMATPWSAFIASEPSSVLLRANKQYLVKKPWHNVQPATMP